MLTLDAGGDKKAAGNDDIGRYYLARATSAMYLLDADKPSDWGKLPAGTRVVKAIYYNLVFGPGDAGKRWYTPSHPSIEVTIPIEHLLHAKFEMPRAEASARAGAKVKDAVKKKAVVLDENDHLQSMDALLYS